MFNEGIPYTKIKSRNENDDQPEKSALLKQNNYIEGDVSNQKLQNC